MSENNSDIDYFHEEVDVEELVSSASSQEPQYVVHCVETAAETLRLLKEWQMPSSVVHKILSLNLTVEDISNLIESDLNTIFAPDQLRDKIRDLVTVLVEFFLERDITLGLQQLNDLAEQIVETFPTEIKVMC
uniref:Uncharacterized protein n=1 Tax=Phlebotomus papatasi TaxID=29031 RepID=A0A1B0EY75_PHLPP